MKNQKGFSLIELLIVVVIILIIAAIAIPSLLRARVSANESAVVGDTRSISSAEVAYASANCGWFGTLVCLGTPSGCIPNYAAAAPVFLDIVIAVPATNKGGYSRAHYPGGVPPNLPSSCDPGSLDGYCYGSSPTMLNITGVRGFGTDASGVICFDSGGAEQCGGQPTLLAGCAPLP